MNARSLGFGISALAVAISLVGCGGSGGSSSSEVSVATSHAAVIATIAPDFGSSDIEIVALNESELLAVDGYFLTDESDVTVAANGSDFYRIGRFNIDNVTKRNIAEPMLNEWQFSTRDEAGASVNPYALVFLNDTKAYLLRYASSVIWVVNPEATTAQDFKLGEIDLSAYNDSDGLPEITGGKIVDGKLFVIMQRLDRDNGYEPSNTSYVAVIDTASDTEIATGKGEGDLNGIALQTRNPESIEYKAGVGLFVQSVGGYFPASYVGGIESVNTTSYDTSIVIDDGTEEEHIYGLLNKLVLVDSETAYFVGYSGWQDTSLYRFNPSSGAVASAPVEGFTGLDIRGLALGPAGRVWVSLGDNANPRVALIDPATDAEVDSIPTTLNPAKVVFVQE